VSAAALLSGVVSEVFAVEFSGCKSYSPPPLLPPSHALRKTAEQKISGMRFANAIANTFINQPKRWTVTEHG